MAKTKKATAVTGTQFVVIYPDGFMKLVDEETVSAVFDIQSKGGLRQITDVMALNQDNELVSVKLGPRQVDRDYPGNNSSFYATSAIFAGEKLAGFAYYTKVND